MEFFVVDSLIRYKFDTKKIVEAVAQKPAWAYTYSTYKDTRFKEGEDAMLSRPSTAVSYLKSLKRKNIEITPDLMAKAIRLFKYNLHNLWFLDFLKLLDRPVPALEPAISQEVSASAYYAEAILKDRFRLGEHVILQKLQRYYDRANIETQKELDQNASHYKNLEIGPYTYNEFRYLIFIHKLGYKLIFNQFHDLEIVKA